MTTPPPQPRSIEGSIGSRIRVILGDTGDQWLLLLNHDDGNRKWQTPYWTASLCSSVGKQINRCTAEAKMVAEVDFGPNLRGGKDWFVRGTKRDGSHCHKWWSRLLGEQEAAFNILVRQFRDLHYPVKVSFGQRKGRTSMCIIAGRNSKAWNINAGLMERLKRNKDQRIEIHFVRLFNDGAYFIRDDEGCDWHGLSDRCVNALEFGDGVVSDVAVAGPDSWIVILPNTFVATKGVNEELKEKIQQFYNQQRERMRQRRELVKDYHEEQRAHREAEWKQMKDRREAGRLTEDERVRNDVEEATPATVLEVRLVEQLTQEKESTNQLERDLEGMQGSIQTMRDQTHNRSFIASLGGIQEHIQTMQERLETRKRSFRESERLPFLKLAQDELNRLAGKNQHCVICHANEPVRAAVPCGHLCFCDECGSSFAAQPPEARLCPLCRQPIQSTITIHK